MVVMKGYKQTEVGEMPEDWAIQKLSCFAILINGRAFKQHELLNRGKYEVLRVGNFFTNNTWYYSDLELPADLYVDFDDLMYAWSASFGPQFWKGSKCIYHYHIWKVLVRKNADKHFLYHLFDFDKSKLLSQTQGGTMFHLTKSGMEERFFPLPPLPEQTAIATALSDMDALIAQTEKLIEKKKAIKQGVMQELLRPKEGWVNVAIRDISKVGRGRVISNKEISKSIEELYPVYSSQTTNNGIMGFIDSFDFEGEYITWTTDGEKAGTVFFRNGRFNCTNVCGTIKLKNYNAKFIAYVLAIESPKHVSRNLANPKLMNEPMKNVRITIPVDINEQEDIANSISYFENEIEALEAKYNKLKHQKQGMMQALLTGKIRLV